MWKIHLKNYFWWIIISFIFLIPFEIMYQVYSMAWKVPAEKPEFSGLKNWIFKWTIFDYLKFPTSKFHDFFSFSCSKLKADAIRFFWSDAWLTSEEEPNLEKINKFCPGKIQTSIWFFIWSRQFQDFSWTRKTERFHPDNLYPDNPRRRMFSN